MITHTNLQIQNVYIQQLKESLAVKDIDSAECLILSHRDENLMRRLSPVSHCLNSLVLQIPQSDWRFGTSLLAEAISWAIEQAGIRSIYICGHSYGLAENPLENAHYLPNANESEGQEERLSDRLGAVARLMENQTRLQNAKNHFAERVDQMLDLPIVYAAIRNSNLKIHALFFLSQAGTFLTYDPSKREFHTLIPEENHL